jgi:hypothetical protein
MSVPEYHDKGPVAIPSSLAVDDLVGRSVLITGGECLVPFRMATSHHLSRSKVEEDWARPTQRPL